tara:strand:- start:229 stop:501 length:273 start_codon:yes stop_codon:yes gene_type:complete
MFKSLPIELYYKILNYGAIEPPHLVAYKTAKIRPIFSNELNCNISGNIKLNEEMDLFAVFDDVEINLMSDLDAEYYMFLLNQDLSPTSST